MGEIEEMTFDAKVRGAMSVAQEWLDILSKIELTDEERAVKAMEVSVKLAAQLFVFGLYKRSKTYAQITKELRQTKLRNINVKHDQIEDYGIAKHMPEPETLAKLYLKYRKSTKAFGRVRNKKTVVLTSAVKLTHDIKGTGESE